MTLQERCEAQARSLELEGWHVAASVLRLAADALPTDGSNMTPEEYRAALDALNLTQAQAAKLMEVDERTSRRWALGERAIPGSVSLALELMQGQQIKAGQPGHEVIAAQYALIGRLEREKGRLDAVATERWHELKAAEKLTRQLEKALKAVLYIAKTDTGPVHSQLRRDIREVEKVLEIVASRKRERRA